MLVFCLSSFSGLASCRMPVERGEKEKETSDSSKWSCRRKGHVLPLGSGTLFVFGYEWALYSWPMIHQHGAMGQRGLPRW